MMVTPDEFGITGICLPSGETIDAAVVRSINYNPNIGALRFSFAVTKHLPISVDSLTGRVKGIQKSEGRCVVIAHRHFRYNDELFIQDADVKIINL